MTTIPPSPSEVGTWLNVALFLLSCAAAVITIIGAMRRGRQEVTFGFQPASKEEFNEEKVKTNTDIREIFQRLNHTEASIKQNTAVTEINTATMVRLEGQLLKIMERIPNEFRNT